MGSEPADSPIPIIHGTTPAQAAVAGAPLQQQAERQAGGDSPASNQHGSLTCQRSACAGQGSDAAAEGANDETAAAGNWHADADAAPPNQTAANASQQRQEVAESAAATVGTGLDASTGLPTEQGSPAGAAELDDASPEMPSNALSEVLEELCQQQELGLAAIDAGIRRRLAQIPDALRFRPGHGAGLKLFRKLPIACASLDLMSATDCLQCTTSTIMSSRRSLPPYTKLRH